MNTGLLGEVLSTFDPITTNQHPYMDFCSRPRHERPLHFDVEGFILEITESLVCLKTPVFHTVETRPGENMFFHMSFSLVM